MWDFIAVVAVIGWLALGIKKFMDWFSTARQQ